MAIPPSEKFSMFSNYNSALIIEEIRAAFKLLLDNLSELFAVFHKNILYSPFGES